MIKTRSKGFTLIELLVVIAIIGILSSVVLASLNDARQKSRDAKRIADVKQVQLALALYFDSNGAYPTTTASLVPQYISAIPKDPVGNTAYSYAALTSGGGSSCASYHLGTSLENSSHSVLGSDIDASAGTACSGSAADFAGTDSGKCNASDNGSACYDVKP